jgi:GNAT superfamily N-acetyltransferase
LAGGSRGSGPAEGASGAAAGEGRGPGSARVIPYERRFEDDLVDICWRTGLMGESLEGTGRFEDRRLFGMLFCLPYTRFEPASCFVALAPRDAARPEAGEVAVGYIIGTADTPAQSRNFSRRWVPRIAARLLLYDWWRHPESFRQTLAFAAAGRRIEAAGGLSPELGGPAYPAQLHIDLLPEWQGRGLGSRLMAAYLGALRGRGCPGVFLETSDRNVKALPFYRKLGFQGAGECPVGIWKGLPSRSLAFTLTLREATGSL